MDRCAVLVDAGYLYPEGGRLCCGTPSRTHSVLQPALAVDLLQNLAKETTQLPVLRTYWYDGARDGIRTREQREVAGLPNVKLRLGRLNVNNQQKGVDALIYRDLITLVQHRAVSDVVLLSGDEDLCEGVRAAQDFGVRVVLVSIACTNDKGNNQSEELLLDADHLVILNKSQLSVLPDLLVDAEHAVQAYERSLEACRQASEVYQLARAVLKHGGRADLVPLVCDRAMRYAEETNDPQLIGAATWYVGQAALSNDMPQTALDIAMTTAEKFERLLPEGTPEHFYVYGGLLQLGAIAAMWTGDPWRARELLRDPARKAAERVGEGKSYHHIFFGPTNLGIHAVSLELEAGEISEALRLADEVDISKIGYSERQTSHLYQLARCYECRNNDTAVFVHLRMAAKICPQDFLYTRNARSMVSTLVKRAKPSYAAEVPEFAGQIGLLN